MLGGEFNHPNDWLQSVGALQTLDTFAGLHHGSSPASYFLTSRADSTTTPNASTAPRGNAAAILTKDSRISRKTIVPYIISRFGVSLKAENWGHAGWPSGATCALNTTVRNRDVQCFRAARRDPGTPNAGTKDQTLARLFDGDEKAWAAFDPKTVITEHGPYDGISARLGVSDDIATVHRAASTAPPAADEIADGNVLRGTPANANKLCALLSGYNVECSVVGYSGGHDFQSAGAAFADALPWLARALGTPEVRDRPLPGSN